MSLHFLVGIKNDVNKRDNKAVAATEQLKNVINCNLISATSYIGDDGVVALAEGLLNTVNLQCLDIIVMEDDGAMGVAKGLPNALNLQHLDLLWNKIGNKGYLAVAERLRNAVKPSVPGSILEQHRR